jgi:hypothetical protein
MPLRLPAYVTVDVVRIGPVGFDGDDAHTAVLDERLRNARAQVIELGRAVARFAEQDHARIADALEQTIQVGGLPIVERLGVLGDDLVQSRRRLASRARATDRAHATLCVPALRADQRHELHGAEILFGVTVLGLPAHEH